MPTLFLASASPRRRELLTQIGVPFTQINAPIDETPLPCEAAGAYVARLAAAKAAAGWAHASTPGVVLGADTVVVLDGRILGKPQDRDHALSMLADLSGRTHQVITAVALTDGERHGTLSVATDVQFRTIDPAEAARYWATGEPVGKAGGYAVQGLGAVFVERLAGSYSTVVGLPLFETARLLADFGIGCWQHEDATPR